MGEDSPDKLRSTVLFLLDINLGLRAGDKHYYLCRHSPYLESQLTFKMNDQGVRCLVYQEDTVTKTHDGGLNSMRKDRKIVWVYPSSNIQRCPVRQVDKYLGLCPPVDNEKKRNNLYLRSLSKTTPAQWYSTRVLGINAIKKTVGSLLKDAKLDRYFTNYSLPRSSTTRLFQARVDRKLVKEFTGHSSDAVDKYQITSHDQRKHISSIISGENPSNDKPKEAVKIDQKQNAIKQNELEISLINSGNVNSLGCTCTKKNVNLSDGNGLGQILSDILNGRMYEKAKIKLEIDLTD